MRERQVDGLVAEGECEPDEAGGHRVFSAADAAQAEVVRLLAQKIHHAQLVPERASAVANASRHLDGREHAERAVEPSAAGNRVRVRPGDEHAARGTRQRTHQVAGRILHHHESGIAHPGRHPFA